MSLPIPKIRFRSLALSVLVLATLLLIYHDAESCGVLAPVSNRMRFHAIPVALSQLYHGRAHDYTAYNSIAIPFQSDRPLQELLDEFSAPGVPVDGTYYWAADDRGLSDYVYAAFALFGPNVASFGKLYILLLLLSSLLFIVAHWRDTTALAFLVFALCGIDVLTHVLAIAARASTSEGLVWREPVGLFESRVFDMLSFIALLHFVVFSSKRQIPSVTASIALALQVVFFVLIYHARSSLGWQVFAVGAASAAYAMRSLASARPFRLLTAAAVAARPLIPLAVLAVGLMSLAAYQRWTYYPRYFQDMGARTFWHNALMGFSDPKLRARYGTTVDDRAILELVFRRMKRRHDPRLTAAWKVDDALDSLGGHAAFDWAAYEQAARETYWHIWSKNPARALNSYAVCKPTSIGWEVAQVAWPSALGRMGDEADAFRFLPFRAPVLAIVLIAIGLIRTQKLRNMPGSYAKMLVLLVPFSLIPSVAFYPALPTLMGFLMTLTLGTYLGVAWLVLRLREGVRLWRTASEGPVEMRPLKGGKICSSN